MAHVRKRNKMKLLYVLLVYLFSRGTTVTGQVDPGNMDCNSSPCLNGGTCQTTAVGFFCVCPDGFGGLYCENCVENVALGKRTIMSSTYNSSFSSDKAVDGLDSQDMHDHSCIQTRFENFPWFIVDLGAEYEITHVKVFNRMDCCTDELRDLQLNTGSTMSSITEQGMINGSVGSTGVYNLDPYVNARYVLLQMQAPDLSTMQLCEVQVFGICKPKCGGVPYDSETQICCGTTLFERENEYTECCGTAYDNRCYSCYNGYLVPLFSESQLCCNGVIQDMTHSESCCCGNSVFDASTDVCCNNVVRARNPTELHCCQCTDVRLDIAFVVDGSEVQTSDDHYHLLEFLKSTIQSLDSEIASGNIRIALVVYTHDVVVEFQLNTYSNSAEMLNYVENLTPRVGGTNTADALNTLYTEVFNSTYDERPDVENVAVLFSDGRTNLIPETLLAADDVKSAGTRIVTVAIGPDVKEFEINYISSDPVPENAFHVDQFDDLMAFKSRILNIFSRQCDVPPAAPICGAVEFDPLSQVCCGYTVVNITDPAEKDCCGTTLYNSILQSCCAHNTVYDSSTEICCGGTKYSTAFQCCNNMYPFNALNEVCCIDTVQPLHGAGTTECCARTSYDTGCSTCVNDTVVQVFNENTELCCDGNIQPKLYTYSCCCGQQVFDAETKVCCDGALNDRTDTDEELCCHCINKKLDIAFVFDLSGNISDNTVKLQYLKDFAKDVIMDSDVDSGNARIALVVYTNDVSIVFQLGSYSTAAGMINAINSIPVQGGGRNTGGAIESLHKLVFTNYYGDRLDVSNVAIIVTDGRSDNNLDTVQQANIARAAGIHMLTVGVGMVDTSELYQIASSPTSENILNIGDFSNLFSIEAMIEAKFREECRETPELLFCGITIYDPRVHVCCDGDLVSVTDSNAKDCCRSSTHVSLYNALEAVCCNGNVLPITMNGQDQCCGTFSLYNKAYEKCCGGNTISMSKGCCADTYPFNPSSQICCNGIVNPLYGLSSTECCSTVSFDNGCNQCINGAVVPSYNERTHICCQGVVQPKLFEDNCCCGQSVIDASNSTCCNGYSVPRPSTDTSFCCHCINRLVDVALVADTSESVHDAPGNLDILLGFLKNIISGSDVDSDTIRFAVSLYTHEVVNVFFLNTYNTAAAMMARIDAITVPHGGSSTGAALENLHSLVFSVSNGDRAPAPNIAVIITDGKSYNNSYTVEQANMLKAQNIHVIAVGIGVVDVSELHQIASAPTFENVYNVNDFNQLFSLEGLIEQKFVEKCRDYPEKAMCGNRIFNPESHVCCDGYLVPVMDDNARLCCTGYNKANLYNALVEVCCMGNVIEVSTPGQNKCCGSLSLYNPATEQCCGGNTIGMNMRCCVGLFPFDPASQICCNGAVNPLYRTGFTECCGAVSFDTGCNQCINGTVVPSYDERSHICCQGVVQPKLFEYSCCCGQSVIDASNYTCCSGSPVQRSPTDTSLCCHCINRLVDVALVADTSESVHDVPGNLDILLGFLKDIISGSDTDSDTIRFAVSLYTHEVVNVFFMNTYNTAAAMMARIDAITVPHGGSSTGAALENLHSLVFSVSNGDRAPAPNIAVIITDGKSYNNSYTVEQANMLKAQNIHVIAVGIGIADVSELHQIASAPTFENVYNVNDFNQLFSLEGLIEQKFVEKCTEFPERVLCGNVHYNPFLYACCDGILIPITEVGKTHCCGYGSFATLYNPVSEVCCSQNVVPVTRQTAKTCCGRNALYDPNNEECCGEDVISAFGNTTHLCCNGTVQPMYGIGTTSCCGITSYDTRCDQCQDGIVTLGFDERTELCCAGVIQPKYYALSCCCGQIVIDASVSTCCNGVEVPRSSWDNSTCCHCINRKVDVAIVMDMSESVNDAVDGVETLLKFVTDIINEADVDTGNVKIAVSVFTHDVIDLFSLNTFNNRADMINNILNSQIYFGGTNTGGALENLHTHVFSLSNDLRPDAPNIALVITDGKSSNSTYTVEQGALVRGAGIHVIAVGIGLLDYSELHQIASSPTTENVFNVDDFSELYTLEGVIEQRFIENCTDFPVLLFCGNKEYDPRAHVCCDDVLVVVTNHNERTCCGRHHLYDPTTAVCCHANVVPITQPGKTECCGHSSLYNTFDEKCCGNFVISNTLECCGSGYSYDNNTHICCDGMVQPLHGLDTTECCGTQSFDNRCNQCVNGSVTLRYDEETELCCGGVINQKLYTYTCCCGQAVIDASMSTCCNGVEVSRSPWDRSHCCHCTNREVDVAIVADFSESVHDVSENVDYLLDFIADIINNADVDSGNVRIALSVFTHDIFNYFFLDTYNTRAAMIDKLRTTQVIHGGTNTGGALENLYKEVFTPSKGDRVVSPNIAVVITDGKSYNSTKTASEAAIVKALGIHVIAVGIGLIDTSELHIIASNPTSENVHNVADFNELYTIVGVIEEKFTEKCTVLCGNTRYDKQVHVCCNKRLLAVTNQNERTCCGKRSLYDPTSSVCCGGNVIPITDQNKRECCGGIRLYDSTMESCCDGSVYQGPTTCCTEGKADVAIIADSSESVTVMEKNYNLLQAFVTDLIMNADVESDNVHFALTVFTHKVFNEFYLNSYMTKNEMTESMVTATKRSGGTNTGGALENAYKTVFKVGDRPEAQNIALVVTDGQSNNNTYTVEQARLAKLSGIHIIAIGVGLLDVSELHEIASEPTQSNVFVVRTPSDMNTVITSVLQKLSTPCGGATCGRESYNKTASVCCKEKIRPRYDQFTSCCADQSFDTRFSICCLGQIVPATAGFRTKCCGSQPFDPDVTICCGKKINYKSEGKTACCGNRAFNPKDKICCNEKLNERLGRATGCCGSTSFDSGCFKCRSSNIILPKFDSETSLCCNGHIMNRKFGDNSCCCGRKQIDLSKTTCCDGRARDVPQSSPCACCGNRLFNVKNQICCKSSRRIKDYGYDTQCCGDNIYNMKSHICCEEVLHKKRSKGDTLCCGENPYNSRKELCCEGVVHEIPNNASNTEVLCCGTELYEPKQQICCENILYPKFPDHSSCCEQPKTADEIGCCNGTAFDPVKHLCCNGLKLEKVTPADDACCGLRNTYDSRQQVCCNGNVQTKLSGASTQCCDRQSYDPSVSLCCNDKIKARKYGDLTACCENKIYNPLKENCCNGIVIKQDKFDINETPQREQKQPEGNDVDEPNDENKSIDNYDIKNRLNKLKRKKEKLTRQIKNATDKNVLETLKDKRGIIENKIKRLQEQTNNDENVDRKANKYRLNILRRKLKRIKNKLSKATDKSVVKTLKEKKEKILNRISRLNSDSKEDNEKTLTKSNDKSQVKEPKDIEDNSKIKKTRLQVLRNKLRNIKSKLSDSTDKSVIKALNAKKEVVEKRIQRLKSKKSEDIDKETKTDQDRLSILRKRLKLINEKLSKTIDKSESKTLQDKKEIVLKKIRNIKDQNKDLKVGDEPEMKETDGKTDQDRIANLRKKLKLINEKLSKTTDKSESKTLLDKKETVLNKIQKIKDQNKDMKKSDGLEIKEGKTDQGRLTTLRKKLRLINEKLSKTTDKLESKTLQDKKETVLKRIQNIKDQNKELKESDEQEIKETDGKTDQDRLSTLRNKLRLINEKLSKETDASERKTLQDKKETVLKRIQNIKNENKDVKESQKPQEKETDVKTDQDQLSNLREKLKLINDKLSQTTDKSDSETLQDKRETLLQRIQNIKDQNKDLKESDEPENKETDGKTDQNRLSTLRNKLKLINEKLSKETDKSKSKTLQDKKETVLKRIQNIKDENKDVNESQKPQEKDTDGKTEQDRISNLREKLKLINDKISQTTDKSESETLQDKKEIVLKRIRNIKDQNKDLKESNEPENKETDGKTDQDRLSTLRNKLRLINEKLSKKTDKSDRKTLPDKKETVLKRIQNIKDENKDVKESQKPQEKETDVKTDQDRISNLREKLKLINDKLSQTTDKSESKTLQDKKETVLKRIRNIKDQNKDLKESNEPENKETDGKTDLNRLSTLRNKLRLINEKLSKETDASERKTLQDKKETVLKRIQNIKDENKDVKESQKPQEKETDGKTEQDRISNLREKLKLINDKLSQTTDKSESETLQDKKEIVLKRIRNIKDQNKDLKESNEPENKETDGKTDQNRLSTLRNKLRLINEKLSKETEKSDRKTLQDKKETVLNRIQNIKDENKDLKESQKPQEKETDVKTDQDRISNLREKLKLINDKLSQAADKSESKTLQDKKETVLQRILNIKDQNKDLKESDEPEIRETDGKTNQDRLSTLRKKLKLINEKLSKETDKSDRKTLQDKKETVLKRIQNIKDENKDVKESQKPQDKETDVKTDQDRISNLREKLKLINDKLSQATDKSERKQLQDKKETILSKLRGLKDQNKDMPDEEGRSIEEKLEILKDKLKIINEKLSKASGAFDTQDLLEKKENVLERIRRLKEQKDGDKEKTEIDKKNSGKDITRTNNVIEDRLRELRKELKEIENILIKRSNNNEKNERAKDMNSSNPSRLDTLKDKEDKLENKISNTKDKLEEQTNKKALISKRIQKHLQDEVKETPAENMGEIKIQKWINALQAKLERLEQLISDTKKENKKNALKEEKRLLKKRISGLQEEIEVSKMDDESDSGSFDDRLAKLMRKLTLVKKRLKSGANRETKETLQKKRKILERRIERLTFELHNM